jgi:SAM-dependent methyltransferase
MSRIQDEVFFEQEGDSWFTRNREALSREGEFDWPLELLGMLGDLSGLRSIAEVGCCNGYRLDELRRRLPTAERFAGVDASEEAIADGLSRFPGLELQRGVLSDIPLAGQFDLVVVNFVLHWVDRSTLARSLSEIDRLIGDSGLLVLGDFLPDYPQRRRYHHVDSEQLFTYKQDYARVFEALGTYRELARVTFDHDARGRTVGYTDSGSRAFCAVMRKSLNEYYPVVGA